MQESTIDPFAFGERSVRTVSTQLNPEVLDVNHTVSHGCMTSRSCPDCGRRNRVGHGAHGRPRCGQCSGDRPWVVDADDETFASAIDTHAAYPR